MRSGAYRVIRVPSKRKHLRAMNPTASSIDQSPTTAQPPTGEPTKQKIRRTADQAIDQTKQKVSAAASRGKEATADRLSDYETQLRDTARFAQEEEDPNIAHLANTAADRLQRAADYVRDTNFTQLRQDAADVARRHPSLFMGGMLLAGIVAGNLVKASVQTLREDGQDFSDDADELDYHGYGAVTDRTEGNESEIYSPETLDGPQI